MIFPRFSTPDPDAPLVEAARAGDARAFDALVYRYQEPVRLFVRARLDAAIDADDVAQEVFVAAWRYLPRFESRSRFRTWLFGVALNHCLEAARRYRSLSRLLGEYPDFGSDLPESIEDVVQGSHERTDLQRQVAALPPSERETLELYYYAQLSLPEIARLLGVNLNTLKYRFYQSHRRLRERLAGEETPAQPTPGRRELPR